MKTWKKEKIEIKIFYMNFHLEEAIGVKFVAC